MDELGGPESETAVALWASWPFARMTFRILTRELREKRDTRDMWDKWDSLFSPVLSVPWGAHPDRPLSTDSLVYA
jgi:hypothetical protein